MIDLYKEVSMKMSKRSIVKVLSIVMVLMLVFTTNVFGAITPSNPREGNEIAKITGLGANVWSTIQVIVQIAAIAAIVFAGVRYMFASADDKADIKKQTVILIVGAVLVFAAVPFAKFITDIANQIF